MTPKYHVCLIAPQNYIHSLAFKEVALLFIYAFNSLGQPCTFKVNSFDPNAINIILGYNLLKYDESLKNIKYIPYQLEQLSAKNGWFNENIKNVLANAYEVWDYAQENIDFLGSIGIKAKYLPLGYHEALEVIKPAEKDIDVLFIGSINERREKIINELRNNNLNVEVVSGAYGEKRDQYIARTKIILNIHYYDSQIFEAVRVSYLLNNKAFVISEISEGYPYAKVLIPFAKYDDLAEMCLKYIQDGASRDSLQKSLYDNYKKYLMADSLRKVV